MLKRVIAPLVLERLAANPAVALIGPRQSGKTTLARSLGEAYYDLEQDADRLRLDLDWHRIGKRADLIILDEAQAWPDVFPKLRGTIDGDRKRNGRFLLLGSVSPALMTQVSESLAGRLALIELTPLLWTELAAEEARERLWLCGGFPDGGVLTPPRFPQWQTDYLTLLVQRDLPNWGLPARPQVTERLMRMLAAVHGQEWNASRIGKSLGLSYHTVNSYVDYLAGAFLIRRLPPFHGNIQKRLVKSPKLYWRDSGLLHSLLNTANRESLLSQPWVGASWEGFVIEQILGHAASLGLRPNAHYLRTSDRHEIDLLLEMAGELWAFEMKLTASPDPSDLSRLDRLAESVGATRRFLVSHTAQPAGDDRRASANLDWICRVIRECAGERSDLTDPL